MRAPTRVFQCFSAERVKNIYAVEARKAISLSDKARRKMHVGARVGARGNEPLYFVSWSIVSEGIVFVVLKLC